MRGATSRPIRIGTNVDGNLVRDSHPLTPVFSTCNMPREFSNDIERHLAGATVSHAGPFSTIQVPELNERLSRAFYDKWVTPFYRASLFRGSDEFAESLRPIADEITPSILTTLLADYNWRPRITAAYFAAILIEDLVEDQIGNLLLRSDVCFAGTGYCLALARFNSPKSAWYLSKYLTYYLTKPELHFDQGEAIGALAHLDKANGTSQLETFSEQWKLFESASETYDQQKHIDRFAEQYSAVVRIAASIGR